MLIPHFSSTAERGLTASSTFTRNNGLYRRIMESMHIPKCNHWRFTCLTVAVFFSFIAKTNLMLNMM